MCVSLPELHPLPNIQAMCPYCRCALVVDGWAIPGMRTMASMNCLKCKRSFFIDLPASYGLWIPLMLDKATGEQFVRLRDSCTPLEQTDLREHWFSEKLKLSWESRTNRPVKLEVEGSLTGRRPVLLNCLDFCYGHALYKLLNADYYLRKDAEVDLILLLPASLRWMAPKRTAMIWTVHDNLKGCLQWNDHLDALIHEQVAAIGPCSLVPSLPVPHPDNYDIAHFTGVQPFDLADWNTTLAKPIITFIWREDRLWLKRPLVPLSARVNRVIGRYIPAIIRQDIMGQRNRVIKLFTELRLHVPNTQFSVAGFGTTGDFPEWIHDERREKITTDDERGWCELYSRSHLVIGVLGSNMLLPTAHAAASIILMPQDRWGNLGHDILTNSQDVNMETARRRFIPLSTGTDETAEIARSLLISLAHFRITCERENCDIESLDSNSDRLQLSVAEADDAIRKMASA